MKASIYIVILYLLFTSVATYGQSGADKLDTRIEFADALYTKKAYPQAIEEYVSILQWMRSHKLDSDYRYPTVLNNLGEVSTDANQVLQAHRYFTEAGKLADQLHLNVEIHRAFKGLMNVHRKIVREDLPFSYPAVAEKEEVNVFFPVGKITMHKDSADITVFGGKLDGIGDSVQKMELFTRINNNDTVHRAHLDFYGTARVLKIGNNQSQVRVALKPEYVPELGDFISVRALIPTAWRKFAIRDFMLKDIYLVDNYKTPIYNFRYCYYYADSMSESKVYSAMKESIDEIADLYAEDTLTNPQFSAKTAAGIFTGMNVIKAMSLSKSEHLKLFLDFVNEFAAKYIGYEFKISETYATWIINKTPLKPADIKPYLLTLDPAKRDIMAVNLGDQVRKEKLLDQWFDEGMQQVNVENIAEAGKTAALIRQVSSVIQERYASGWASYLQANIERKMGRDTAAMKYLDASLTEFRLAGNKEGMGWINNSKKQWEEASRVTVGVQNGHMFPYILAQSKNQRYFATGGVDYLIKIWDRTLGKEVMTLNEHQGEINSIDYSSNGRYMVSTSKDTTICIWNAYTYSLLYKYKSRLPERVAIFTPDSKYILTAGDDSTIKIRDIQSGEILKSWRLHKGAVNALRFHPLYSTSFYSAGEDSMIYKWSLDADEMTRWYRVKGKALSVKITNDGSRMSIVSTDSVLSVWDTDSHKKLFTGKVFTYRSGDNTAFASESFSADSKYLAFPIRKDTFAVIALQDLYERDYPTLNREQDLCDLQFSDDGLTLFARFDMGGPLRMYNFANWNIRDNPNISWRDIQPFANLPVAVQFTKDDNGLLILHSELSRLDLQNGNNERLFYAYSLIENSNLLLDDEKYGTYFDNYKPVLNIYDYRAREKVKSFSLPESEKLASWELSPKSINCYLGSKQGMIAGWTMATSQPLFQKRFFGGNAVVADLKYDADNNRLFAVTNDDAILVLNATTGDSITTIKGLAANYLQCSKDFIYVSTEYGQVCKLDPKSFAVIRRINVNDKGEAAYMIRLSDDRKYLAVQSDFQSLLTIRTTDDSILYTFKDHDYGGTMIAISHDGQRIATAGFDSKVNMYETATGKKIVSVYLPKDRGALIADDEGHYLANKNTLDAIYFSYRSNAYGFDQFDLQLNRPDIILKKIGRADTAMLRSYYAAYKKRLSRMKVNEEDVSTTVHLPLVKLQERFNVQPVTTKQNYELEIECSDTQFPLRSLQVLVNNSPVLGVNGRDLSGINGNSTIQKVIVPLASGNNSIKVYCTNSKGVQSLRESFDIISKYKSDKPYRVYFIGIAVADYKDKRMNLQYSAKDVRDLAKTFTDLYENITIDTLINQRATKEKILAIRKKLLQTTVNDRVILAVTGHGLLSDSLDFYYATYDVDFNHPEKRGIKYEDLENLLTDIPARQKLMLIDACHSGALDKEQLLALAKDQSSVGVVNKDEKAVKGVVSRGFGLKNKAAKMSANSSFEMMQNLFTDLSGSNGAIIISAAGGMEYAYESGKWNNGVFTYSIRKGIEDKAADTEGNLDGKVSVQELLKYVSNKVSELTNGKQKPTSRRENVEYEWMIRN